MPHLQSQQAGPGRPYLFALATVFVLAGIYIFARVGSDHRSGDDEKQKSLEFHDFSGDNDELSTPNNTSERELNAESGPSSVDATDSRTEVQSNHLVSTQFSVVNTAQEEPIAGASIYFLPCDEENRSRWIDEGFESWLSDGIQTTSDEQGHFLIQRSRVDIPWIVLARKAGFAWQHSVVDSGEEDASVELVLSPSLNLSGVVRNHKGDPVTDAEVRMNRSFNYVSLENGPASDDLPARLIEERSRTDERGFFAFQECGAFPSDVAVETQEYALSRNAWVAPNTHLNITLVPRATLYGYVTDEDGNAVEDARVRTTPNGCIPEPEGDWSATNPEGYYEIDGAHSGSISVIVWAGDRFASDRMMTSAKAGERKRFDIRVRPPAAIKGTVRSLSGESLGGIGLGIKRMKTGAITGREKSSSDGTFEFGGLHHGENYSVHIVAENYAPTIAFNVLSGAEDLDLRAISNGPFLVRATFEGRRPDHVFVRAFPREDVPVGVGILRAGRRDYPVLKTSRRRVGDDGSISFKRWPGIYDVEYRAPGYATIILENATIQPGQGSQSSIDIHFELSQSLMGVVKDGSSKDSIPGAIVSVLDKHIDGRLALIPGGLRSLTDENGAFVLNDIPNETLALRIECEGYAPRTMRDVAPTMFDAQMPFVIELRPGGRIEGQVESDYASPATALQVTVRQIGDSDGQSQFVEPDGSFSFEGAPTGIVEIALRDHYFELQFPTVEPQVRQVEVREGQTSYVRFDAATGTSIEGMVIGWPDAVFVEARQLLDGIAGDRAGAAFTDQSHRFRIPHFLEGNYRIVASQGIPGSSVAVSRDVYVSATTIDPVILEVSDSVLEGVVLSLLEEPLSKALIGVFSGETLGLLTRCLTDAEGSFRIGGLPSESVELLIEVSGAARQVLSQIPVPSERLSINMAPGAELFVHVCDDT